MVSATASGSYTAAAATGGSGGGVSASASGSYTAQAAGVSASASGSYVAAAAPSNGGLYLRTGLATSVAVRLWRRTGLASAVNVGDAP